MNLQTFKAPTMALALQQVKSTMGPDAVILHTRTYRLRGWLPLVPGKEVVEVTAGRGLGGKRRPAPPPPPSGLDDSGPVLLPGPKPAGGGSGGLSVYGTPAIKLPIKQPHVVNVPPAQPPVLDPVANGKAIGELPSTVGVMIRNVSEEMATLKKLMAEVVKETRSAASPNVPDDLFDHYQNLIQNHVAQELAIDIIRQLTRDLTPEQLARPDVVRERVAGHIERLVPSCAPVARRANATGPHVLALIGPTGVGKTTTLAKLAANLKLKDGHRVGLITLDTYRIAAVDQLRRYAEILGSPLKVVSDVDELRSAMSSMSHLDFVLIDTAGRSPKDAAKLAELRVLLDSINPDDVHLVLSSTSSQSSVELACQRFGEVRVDKMIFTKLDEASHVGVVLNVCHKVNKALSYVTMGQDVPNDIEVGQGRLLAKMILGSPAIDCGSPAPKAGTPLLGK